MQREVLSRCDNLLSSADFQWFLKECVQKLRQAAEDLALDVSLPPEECTVARSVRKSLLDVEQWVAHRQLTARQFIKSVDAEKHQAP